ncbi:MAG: hypothetical protein IT435_14625 [Phycisphaerales bacterium]|nr:hypothetical protein [Phycisphaerales bacterium]
MSRRVLGTCAGIAMFGAATELAGAAVVMHDNSEQTFKWTRGLFSGEPVYDGTFLDITKPASEQSGERRPGTIGRWYYPNQSSSYWALSFLWGESGAEIARTTDWVWIDWQDLILKVKPARDYAPGEFVTSSDNWIYQTDYYWHLPFDEKYETGSPGIGEPAYLGVRVKMADNQWHYGWIYFTDYQWPLAWAYETEPNTPIQVPIPAPSAGMLMLVGISRFIQRRSRR